MKKFLVVGLLALTSVSAFAQKHMVQLGGYETTRGAALDRSLDLYNSSGGTNATTTTSIALNYAYAITGAFQLGAEYRKWDSESKGKNSTDADEMGIFGIYNFAGQVSDTTYVGLKYLVGTTEVKTAGAKTTDTDSMTLQAELGHRFSLGTLWGMNYNWSPSVTLGVVGLDPKSGDESSQTEFALNVLKVDVLF